MTEKRGQHCCKNNLLSLQECRSDVSAVSLKFLKIPAINFAELITSAEILTVLDVNRAGEIRLKASIKVQRKLFLQFL